MAYKYLCNRSAINKSMCGESDAKPSVAIDDILLLVGCHVFCACITYRLWAYMTSTATVTTSRLRYLFQTGRHFCILFIYCASQHCAMHPTSQDCSIIIYGCIGTISPTIRTHPRRSYIFDERFAMMKIDLQIRLRLKSKICTKCIYVCPARVKRERVFMYFYYVRVL